jgi:3-phosphoglycerate kinase
VTNDFANGAPGVSDGVTIAAGLMGMDIGPKTVKLYADEVKKAGTIVWNGPMGVFERPAYANGTRAIAEAAAEATAAGGVSVIGGGDSAAAVAQMGLDDKMTHISTGGGASLKYLEGKVMPPIEVLDKV